MPFVDDQAAQADYRENSYVGHIIDQACTVYDTMFNALEYAIKGKANAIKQLDKVVEKLEKQCSRIAGKYKEILEKLKDPDASAALTLSIDVAKDSLAILNENPILRRYVGEANYWMLWDMLAVMSGQGMSVGADVSANLKDAVKTTIYALLSMTNGMMHFESYISQITQFWGWLYIKEIPLPLADSICPQVTCQYYYRKALAGNPVPGPKNYAPMPFPVFNQADYSWPYILSHFSYDNPDTWDVLTPASRSNMQKAYDYWTSNYTNAVSANDLLSGASSILTGGNFTVGFGLRHDNYPGGSPLKIGSTFHQLDRDENVGFSVRLMPDAIEDAFAAVDRTFLALISAMDSDLAITRRDDQLTASGYGDYAGAWDWTAGQGWLGADEERTNVIRICSEAAATLPEFSDYKAAVANVGKTYRQQVKDIPYGNAPGGGYSALSQYLLDFYGKLAGDGPMASYIENAEAEYYVFNPYQSYSDDPEDLVLYCLVRQYVAYVKESSPFYTGICASASRTLDVEGELGLRVDGGREPLFAALGVYGNLIGLYPWSYSVVPLDTFKENYTRIRGAYHIYYMNDDPSRVIFADRVLQAGAVKYIAVSKAAATDEVSRGTGQNAERYISYIFPSETCAVYEVPAQVTAFGTSFPSLASCQRVDAVNGATGQQYMYDLTRNQIPRYPKHVDADRWSLMDLIHELWLLADALTPICGDGGERKAKLDDLLNGLDLKVKGSSGPVFIGQLPESAGQGDLAGNGTHAEFEFGLMNEFASRIRFSIDAVYDMRDAVLAATQAW